MSTNSFLLKHLTVEKISLFFILVLFAFTYFGIVFSDVNYFSSFIPVVIAFGGFLIFINSGNDLKRLIYLLAIILASIILNIVSIKTGMIFGWFTYGNNLGPKVMNVPVLMGIFWLSLLYGAGMLGFLISKKPFWQWFWAAFFMMLIDVFIETSACKLDFWCFNNGILPPLQNFWAWFLLSFLMIIPFRYLSHDNESRYAAFYFIILLVFFVMLNMINL